MIDMIKKRIVNLPFSKELPIKYILARKRTTRKRSNHGIIGANKYSPLNTSPNGYNIYTRCASGVPV
ncbi:MAG: hypothetical protein K5669_08715 [Lachnospiraceae bacterium]|nr:hypothetical protein [Lachnospiraceae bacterium]